MTQVGAGLGGGGDTAGWGMVLRSRLLLLLVSLVMMLALVLVAGRPVLPLPAALVGVILFILALALALQGLWRSLRQMLLLHTARALIRAERSAAFITDETGTIRARNAAATAHHGGGTAGPLILSLTALLASIFADPAAAVASLTARAGPDGSASEKMMTRRGPLQVSITRLNLGLDLWRLSYDEDAGTGALGDIALPYLTAGSGGTVLYMNAAFRRLIGHRAHSLDEVFVTLPPENGRQQLIRAARGDVSCLVAVIEGRAGRREIYLLPGTAQGDGAEWDDIGMLPVPILMLAPDGLIRAANDEALALLPMEIAAGTRFFDLVEGLGRPISDWIRETAEGRGTDQAQFLRGTGSYRDLFLRVALSPGGRGQGRHVLAILSDVTEYKMLEAQFVQSQKMEAIGQLAGGISHDFNNLLTAISGHCDLLLLNRDEIDHDYPDLVQIRQNANRAAGLVGQLLAFSRKQSLTPEVLDLRDTLADLAHLLGRLVGERVRLALDHDPALHPIRADRRQLEQVIMNLVVNARDAMSEGGVITITTENHHLPAPLERERARIPAGDHVTIRVADTGVGIPPERLGKIFEPFYTTKRSGEGTGLGLSTAYGIVKQTGGFIFVDSTPGKGTTFTLWFPASDDRPPPTLPVPAPGASMRAAKENSVVLLVEDEAPVRAFAARALRLRGHQVLEADCAETALALLADPDLHVDVFLSDVIMPGKDGPSWVREALRDRPGTRVIFVSGYAEDGFADHRAMIAGAIFLPKPFSLGDLAAAVRAQLQ